MKKKYTARMRKLLKTSLISINEQGIVIRTPNREELFDLLMDFSLEALSRPSKNL